jgi:hypothetical protein
MALEETATAVERVCYSRPRRQRYGYTSCAASCTIRTRDERLSRVSHLLFTRIAAIYARLRFLKNSLLAAKVIICEDIVGATGSLRPLKSRFEPL